MLLLVAATEPELGGHEGVICGVGPVEAAAATAAAIAAERPVALLHVGLAGGRGLEVGTVVVGTEAVYCDIAAEWPVVDRVEPDPGLLAAVRETLPRAAAMPIHTSAAVGACNSLLQAPLVEGMEGFGVLRAAALAGVPAVEVRAISNELGEPDRTRWDLQRGLDALSGALEALVPALQALTARES